MLLFHQKHTKPTRQGGRAYSFAENLKLVVEISQFLRGGVKRLFQRTIAQCATQSEKKPRFMFAPPSRCYCQYDNRKNANNQAIFTKHQKARKVLRNAGLSHSYLRNSAIFFEIMKDSLHFFNDM
ncbi:MAG: hypothetical protein ACI4MM_09275 [Candidatus Ventricola sp.]